MPEPAAGAPSADAAYDPHWVRRMLQALDGYWLHCDGYQGTGHPQSMATAEDWWIRFEKYRARVEGRFSVHG